MKIINQDDDVVLLEESSPIPSCFKIGDAIVVDGTGKWIIKCIDLQEGICYVTKDG